MNANNGLSSNQLQILKICEELYKNEIFLSENYIKNQDYKGYLIQNKFIEKIKTKINYEKIKPFVDKREYEQCKKEIKDIEIKLEELTPKQYKKSGELKTELLNDNKSFYIIKKDYLSKIIDNSKLQGKEIKFKFLSENLLKFEFSEEGILEFSYDKNFIIEKSSIKNNISSNSNTNNVAGFKTSNGTSDNIKFNKDFEILVRIFYFNKYLTEKENVSFIDLNKGKNNETIYLIQNSWMEEYKSYFDYQSLENYLENEKEYSDAFVKNNYNLSTETIDKIIKSLPVDYINKINEKKEFDRNKDFKYEFHQNKNGLNFLCNNHIINSKIYELLVESKYKLNDLLKTFDLYFIGNKQLLLLSKEIGSNKDADEIGSINNKGIFIPEYIFNYNENNNISLDILNTFFKMEFLNFHINEKTDICEIKNGEKNIGKCYKLNNKTPDKVVVTPENNGSKETTDNGNTSTIQANVSETTNQLNNTIEFKTPNGINPYIELMINIYLFKEELKNKINKNLKEAFEERYYIINKKWVDDFKELFDYDNKFLNYLKQGNINEIINKHNPNELYDEFLYEIIKLFNDDYINEINSKTKIEKINELKNINNYKANLKEKNKIYYYYNNIEIINDKIKNIIQKIFYVEIFDKRIFLFGDEKIIMDLDYEKQYSLILGDYTNNYFDTKILLNFYTNENIKLFINFFKSNGYKDTMKKFENHNNENEVNFKEDNTTTHAKFYKIENFEKEVNKNGVNTNPDVTNGKNITSNVNNKNEQNNNNNAQSNKNKIIIDKFLENQIKALIAYYLFNNQLKQNINSSEIIKSECYLIEENWMKKYKDILLDENLELELKNAITNENNKAEKIYEQIKEKYLNNIKDKENQILKDIHNVQPSKEIDIFESGNIDDIIKYNNLKLYIIDKETYKYMNIDPNKKLIISQNKDYIINNGKLFISIIFNQINKFEILICSFDIKDNYIIPEKLYKYSSITLMVQDIDSLEKNDFKKFESGRILNNNELINKNSNEKIGKIYDLKSPNLSELIKNNDTNNNNQSTSTNEDEHNEKKKKTLINNNSKLIMHFEEEMNQGEDKQILRSPKKNTNIQKGTKYLNSNETKQVLNAIKQPQITLDDTKKNHIEFLLRYICFEDKLNTKIKYPYIFREKCYIINYSIIENFKNCYESKELFGFFKNDINLKNIYNKCLNQFKYIGSHNEDMFINESIQNLPKDYIKKIQEKNIQQFLKLLENIDLYKPIAKSVQNQQQYYYFSYCVLINEYLGKYFLSLIHAQNKNNILENTEYIILNGKLILIHNSNIYFGNINNDKSIYVPEIMICCQGGNELKNLANKIMNEKINIDIILQQTKRINNNNPNIGYYNNTNNIVIIINGNYFIKENQKLFQEQGQGQVNQGGIPNINSVQQQMQGLSLNVHPQAPINIPIIPEIKIILNIIIDLKIIKTKIKLPMNKHTKYAVYYPINNEWIKKFMDYYNIYNLYTNKIINQTFDEIIFNNTEINTLPNEEIIENSKINNEFMNIINSFSKNISNGKYVVSISIYPKKINSNGFFYFQKFSLVSENTMKYLKNYINNNYNIIQTWINYCYFGDNKIIIANNGVTNNNFSIIVYYLDNSSCLLPEIFFKYNSENNFANNLNLLRENGLEKFCGYLMFNNDDKNLDLASPIFDMHNKEIGYAYKYHPNINDYSPYIINKDYKTMLKLYFNYIKFGTQSINNNCGSSYLLINKEFFKKYKDFYEYQTLKNLLSQNNIAKQTVKKFKDNSDYILNDKMLALIIKNLPNNINKKFNEKSNNIVQTGNTLEKPKINEISNLGIFYYDEFEIIDNNLYSSIFKKNNIGIYGVCYFVNGYICIKMPNQINSQKTTHIYIFGHLHSDYIFKADYLLEYNSENDFINNFNFSNQTGGFDKYIFSFQFKNNYIEEIVDINNKSLGIIYNIKKATQPGQAPQPPYQNQNPVPQPHNQVHGQVVKIPSNKHPLIGLKNVGATCYMNATLQCLSQIYPLADYFINNQQVNNIIAKFKYKNELCLTESFKILIDNLWPQYYNSNHQKNSNNYYYAPYDFKDKISKMNPLFEGAQANDAKDLVNYIIMTLHEELNIYPKNNNNNAIINPNLQSNQMYIFNNFMNNFFKENKSIISDIFYGIHHTTTFCSNCQIPKHNYEVYFFLTFPLEEVRKYKLQNLTARNNYIMNQMNMNQNMMMNMNNPMMMNQMNMNQNMMMNPMNINQNINMNVMNPMNINQMNMNNNMNMNINMNININNNMNLQQEFSNNLNKMNLLNQNKVDIYDCFEYYQNPEEFTGQNAMYCDTCKNQFPAEFQTILYNAPEVLIIVLNRGHGNQFKTKLKFNFKLNLIQFLEDKNSGCLYELIGLVTHMGESGGSGHFIATCKSPRDNSWYQYNDDLVFSVTDFNQQMLDYATPYILFFKKIKMGN